MTGVILAGGKSRRMGGDPKALLSFGGRPLIQHIVELLGTVFPDCLIVTNTPDLYAFLGRPMVGDIFPEGGSLGGIYSGLRAAPGDAAFCVACDMPFLSAPLIAHLASLVAGPPPVDVVVPDVTGDLQPLHAVYRKGCLAPMARRLREGSLKVAGFFGEVRVLHVPVQEVAAFADPALAFMNLNTPEDLARARALWATRS